MRRTADRVLFPETGFSRRDAVDYYRRVAKFLLPHLKNRPVSFKRFPDTVDAESFWEKDAPSFTTVGVYSLRAKSERPYVSMPVSWAEVKRGRDLYFEPEDALARLAKRGDLWKTTLTLKQSLTVNRQLLTGQPARAVNGPRLSVNEALRLPKVRSQSGRRLFVLVKGDAGDELWLDFHGKFKRWILRADRDRGKRLIAMPAGEFKVDPAFYRGEVPEKWKSRVHIEDIGAYELVEGSDRQNRFDLWFSGRTLDGGWVLQKIEAGDRHRSWELKPV